MISEQELLGTVSGLRQETLHVWIERGWVSPSRGGGVWMYREIDVARIRLIRELGEDLQIGEDAIDVVLPLLDQVHGLRRQLKLLADAIDAQPEEVRSRIRASLSTPQR